jgi:hypothetical protein
MGLRWLCILLFAANALNAAKGERFVESVLPSLTYGSSCWSSIDLQNLGDRTVTLELESHRASGALVPLVDHPQVTVLLSPGQHNSYRLESDQETGSGWVKIREKIPEPGLSSIVAISGHTECVADNHLRTTAREVAYPSRNPTFSSDVEEMHGNLISLVNTSERPAKAWLCYSAGNLYSLPGPSRSAAELTPICSSSFELQIPPFGARQFPVERDGNSHFSMKTQGDAVVLQMLRPVDASVKIYSVDSSIKFGGEASSK